MRRVFFLLMVVLCVCSSAFAENLEDVLKDCPLDRNRWIVVDWFKAEQFVRFYDSQSVSVTGPEKFDVIIYDYYYGDECDRSSCKQRGKKHYHSEKWNFNTKYSKGVLQSLATKDSYENVVDSYDYPPDLQIPVDIKRKSIEEKTLLKVKESVKGNKDFNTHGTDYIHAAENIKKSEAALLQPQIPVDLPTLIALEKKILAGIEDNDIRLEELRRLAKKDNISDDEVASFISSIKKARIDWVRRASAGRLLYVTDTVQGVGEGSTWEEIQIVFGKPKVVDRHPGGIEYKYDGLVFCAWMGGGKNVDPNTWKSDRAIYFNITGPNYTSDKGIKLGMTNNEITALLSKYGDFRSHLKRGENNIMEYYYVIGKTESGYDSCSNIMNATFESGRLVSYRTFAP